MKRLLATLALGSALFVPERAASETLDDALANAYRTNPNLEEARLAVRAAREDRVQARASYLPSLTISASQGVQEVESTTVGFFGPSTTVAELEPSTASAALSQQLYTGGRRAGQSRLAHANVEGAQEGLRATEQDVLLAAVDAYLSVRRDEQIVELNEAHVEALVQQLSGARRRLDVGEVSRTDVAQAQTRLAGAQAALAGSRAALEASRARYEAIIGTPPRDLTPVAAPPETPHSLEEALERAEARHPDLLRARANVRAARARVAIERAALLPQVALVGRFDQSEDFNVGEPRRESSSAVAQFSMPLYEGGFARSRTRQSRVNVERAEALTEAQRRAILATVTSAWNELVAGREVLSAAREQVEASQIAVQGTERERGLGLRTTLDVLDAQQEARNAQIALVRAEVNALFAAYALLEAIGELTIETGEPQE